jgi:hypothetical protein
MGMSNTPVIAWTKIIQPMVFIEYRNESITLLLSFVRVTQYFSKFQKIWYGAQIILGMPKDGYCTFVEYFTLWTWIQHAWNVFKIELELCIALIIHLVYNNPIKENTLWTKLAIPLYRRCQILYLCLYLFVWVNKTKLHAIPSFYSFLIVVDCWGSIGVVIK